MVLLVWYRTVVRQASITQTLDLCRYITPRPDEEGEGQKENT